MLSAGSSIPESLEWQKKNGLKRSVAIVVKAKHTFKERCHTLRGGRLAVHMELDFLAKRSSDLDDRLHQV
jgi:hypothetical protein